MNYYKTLKVLLEEYNAINAFKTVCESRDLSYLIEYMNFPKWEKETILTIAHKYFLDKDIYNDKIIKYLILRTMHSCLYGDGLHYITNVEYKDKICTITTHKPKILIGVRGNNYRYLINTLKEVLLFDLRIDIKESTLFNP